MTRSIPWLRVFVEGVVIVGSILLAFGIQAWWDGVQERGEEQALLSSLLEDFRSNVGPLDARIDQHRRMADVADAVLAIVSASDGPAVAVPDSLMAGLNPVTSYDATLGTLAEAQSSGRISVIRNQKLRSMLGAWPGRLADALEEQEAATFLQRNRFPDVLGNYVSVADLGPASLLFVQGRPLGLGGASRDVPVSPGVENYLLSRSVALGRSAVELSGLRAQIDSIVQLLESEQAR